MQALEPFIATFESCGHAHEGRASFGSTSNRENEKFQDLFRRADDSLIQHKRQLYSQGRFNEHVIFGIATHIGVRRRIYDLRFRSRTVLVA